MYHRPQDARGHDLSTPLRAYLDTIGDSLVIGEDDEAFKVHVHTNIPGEALTESQKYGTLELAKIENMQHAARRSCRGPQAARSTDDLEKIEQELEAKDDRRRAGEALRHGRRVRRQGPCRVCSASWAQTRSSSGGQTMNPSTAGHPREDQRHARRGRVRLPEQQEHHHGCASSTAGLTEKKVVVVPSKTVPQGVSAMLVFDPDASEEDNLSAMTDAMAGVTTMQITYAARDSDIDGHNIHAGEYLALWGSCSVRQQRRPEGPAPQHGRKGP